MNKKEAKHQQDCIHYLCEYSKEGATNLIRNSNLVLKLAKSYSGLQVARCNGDLTQRQATRETNIESEIQEIMKEIGLPVEFDGDPRGYVVTVIFPDGKSNNMGGEGWGLY